jgi:SOS response regulatory protein OraA/RecX
VITVTFSPHPDKYRFMHVNLNGEPWRELASSMLKGSGLKLAASYASLGVWTSTWDEWEAKRVKSMAYYKLSKKRYFAEELRKGLLSLGFLDSAVDLTLQQLASLGYLNDEEGVEAYIQRGIRTGKGPQWIRYKLLEKGIGFPQNFEEYYPKELRKDNILTFLKKNKKEKRKAIASLVRKGFSLNEVISVYNDIK